MRARVQQLTEKRQTVVAQIDGAQLALDEAREEKQQAAMGVSTLRGQLNLLER